MTCFRLVQISDTHLSRQQPVHNRNFDAAVVAVNECAPDIIINSGDVSQNGADSEDDLVFAKNCHAQLSAEVLFLAGNHDIGDCDNGPDYQPSQQIDAVRRQRFIDCLGMDQWQRDMGTWRLIGLNAQFVGSNREEEDQQLDFLTAACPDAGARHIALFIHKPPFRKNPADALEATPRFLNPAGYERLSEAWRDHKPRLIACGHIHQYYRNTRAEMEHIWAPSTAMVIPDERQPVIGEKCLGYLEYEFHDDGYDVRCQTLDIAPDDQLSSPT